MNHIETEPDVSAAVDFLDLEDGTGKRGAFLEGVWDALRDPDGTLVASRTRTSNHVQYLAGRAAVGAAGLVLSQQGVVSGDLGIGFKPAPAPPKLDSTPAHHPFTVSHFESDPPIEAWASVDNGLRYVHASGAEVVRGPSDRERWIARPVYKVPRGTKLGFPLLSEAKAAALVVVK